MAAPPQDRTESVNFPNPGTYLVICGVRGHFPDGMFGFVTVLFFNKSQGKNAINLVIRRSFYQLRQL